MRGNAPLPLCRVLAWSLCIPVWGSAGAGAVEAGALCPLTTPAHVARVEGEALHAMVGDTLAMRVALDPAEVPPGYFVAINVERRMGPEGGRVDSLPGFPETDLAFSAPGEYRLNVRVSLVAKASCGGAKAATLLDREIGVSVGN